MSKKKKQSVEIVENIIEEDIAEIMQRSYINYAMNVIIARALPDVRDGLKPVHRRVLYAMKELGLSHKGTTKKSARIVGDTLGRYHPHGDSSVYDAMVRMGQEFSMRYPLVTGQGNFGSIDGDPPSAMRYTEAKLSPFGEEILRDIDKNTVNFIPNFDATLQEPELLPSRFPNLLVNGSSGIAVGMASNIPPHNLVEVVDAIIATIKDENITIKDLMKIIKGPDFPTGGIIMGKKGIVEAYTTGKGKIYIRGNLSVEQNGGKTNIIINDIPYGVNKENLLEKIADFIRDGTISEISDIRDESNKEGIRVIIELKRGNDPDKVINKLYKLTELQTTYSIINIAIVDREPKLLNLKEMIVHYINFQREIISRRTNFELAKAEKRALVLEALIIAGSHIDEVMKIIKSSRKTETAKDKLMKQFGLSDVQAQAILELRIQRLISTELSTIKEEYKNINLEIKKLKEILSDEKKVDEVIITELTEIKDKYGDNRITKIESKYKEVVVEEEVEEIKDINIFISKRGYITQIPTEYYNENNSYGDSNDYIIKTFTCTTDDIIGVFTKDGRIYRIKTDNLPEAGSKNKRDTYHIPSTFNIFEDDIVAYILLSKNEQDYLLFATSDGLIKKTLVSEFYNSRQGTVIIKLKENAKLVSVLEPAEEVLLTTKNGVSIRFSTTNINTMGRVAAGVTGIKLDDNDELLSMCSTDKGQYLLTFTDNGYIKKTSLEEYKPQNRGGKGIKTMELPKNTLIAGSLVCKENDKVLVSTMTGQNFIIETNDIEEEKRTGKGKRTDLMSNDNKITNVIFIL